MSTIIKHQLDTPRQDLKTEVERLEAAFWIEALTSKLGPDNRKWASCTYRKTDCETGVLIELYHGDELIATLSKTCPDNSILLVGEIPS